jgi:carbon-monoxide dehydrogenase medium subunit
MLNLREIHKPRTIEQALALLKQPDTVVLAGGTELLSDRRKDVRAVVDLSGLDLVYIRDKEGAVAIGAMTTLGDVAESPILRAAANGVVAQAAHRSAASLLRNQATVAGTLIAEPAGILATALVAMEATLTLPSPFKGEGQGVRVVDFLARRAEFLKHAIVTEVILPASSLGRHAAIATVARTPRDRPVVSVCVAFEMENHLVRASAVALGGVGDVTMRALGVEEKLAGNVLSEDLIESAAREAINNIDPPSNYRGSAQYRREMVRVLTARVLRGFASS